MTSMMTDFTFLPHAARKAMHSLALGLGALPLLFSPLVADEFTVESRTITERKAVFATVRSVDVVSARARIPGTIASLKVDEGSEVRQGQVIAVVGDEKLALKLKALDAKIASIKVQMAQAKTDLKRIQRLRKSGTVSQSRLDQVKVQVSVFTNQIESSQAERSVIERQLAEGQVVAPSHGRVLSTPVTSGSVIMPGEVIAKIAADAYILRARVPERHARYIKKGEVVYIGARGLSPDQAGKTKGKVRQVYPELQQGHVVADIAVDGLGDFFVGERARVFLPAGTRQVLVIPQDYIATRFGVDLVSLKGANGAVHKVVVQRGHMIVGGDVANGIEILTGLKAGDVLVRP